MKEQSQQSEQETLSEIRDSISNIDWVDNCFVEDDEIVVEEYLDGDDDDYDIAVENGKMLVKDFPNLQVSKKYGYKGKYAIVHLVLKENPKK